MAYGVGLILVSVILAVIPLPWEKWGSVGMLSLFAATFACGLMAFLPSPAYGVIFSAARGYGVFGTALIGGLGWALGEMALFHAGRHAPAALVSWVDRLGPYVIRALRSRIRGFILIFVVTLIPNPLFDIVSILAARIGVGTSAYFIPMAAARVVRSAVIAWLACSVRG